MKKIIFNTSELSSFLNKAVSLNIKNIYIPVLQNFKIDVKGEDATLTATDLDCTIVCKTKVVNDNNEEFSALIPIKFVSDIIAVASHPVIEVVFNDKFIEIISNEDKFIAIIDSSEAFPSINEFNPYNKIELPSGVIYAVGVASETTSNDELRPALTRVCIDILKDKINVVSTDAHCLYLKTFEHVSEIITSVQISKKVAKMIKWYDKATLLWSNNQYCLAFNDCMIYSKLPEELYPDYEAIINRTPPNLTVRREEFIKAIRKASVSIYKEEESVPMKISLSKDVASISKVVTGSSDLDIKIPIEYSGSVNQIALTTRIVLKCLQQLKSDDVQLSIQSETKAVLIYTDEDSNYLGLIMPCKI